MTILEMHAKLGTRWAEIAKSLPGRSDNSVKNRWYSTCSRILRQQQEEAGEAAAGCRRSPIKAEVVGIGAASRGEAGGVDVGDCSDASVGFDGSNGSRPSTPARPLQQIKRTACSGSNSPRKCAAGHVHRGTRPILCLNGPRPCKGISAGLSN